MKVREGLIKYISPETSKEQRMEAALCFAGGEAAEGKLEPNDQLTVLFVLCYDRDAEVAGAARSSLKSYPLALVLSALGKKLNVDVLKKLAKMHKDNAAVLTMIALNEGADGPLLETLAETGPLEVLTILTEDPATLARYPLIAESIKKNPKATAALIEALSPAAPDAGGEEAPAPDTEAGEEASGEDGDEEVKIEDMSVGQKIKLALTGDKTIRSIFITNSNKMISSAVMKNPRLTIEEVVKVANSKTTPDDIMRIISQNKEWTKNYNIRMAMVMNAKTPLQVSLRMLDTINIKDLEKVSKSRYIPSVLSSNADRMLKKKKR
jgi:hypothetical protein